MLARACGVIGSYCGSDRTDYIAFREALLLVNKTAGDFDEYPVFQSVIGEIT
jgi:hypothetical protein